MAEWGGGREEGRGGRDGGMERRGRKQCMSGIARTSEPDETWLLIDNASGGPRQLIQWLGVPREVLGGGRAHKARGRST